MVNTYAAQSGGCRFESLWGFGFSLKGAYYEVGYWGKNFLTWTAMHIDFVMCKKRPFRLIKRFYKPKTSKKCKGVPFDRIRLFSKKVALCRKKTKGGPFSLASTFGSIKICGLVRESNPRSPASQKIS